MHEFHVDVDLEEHSTSSFPVKVRDPMQQHMLENHGSGGQEGGVVTQVWVGGVFTQTLWVFKSGRNKEVWSIKCAGGTIARCMINKKRCGQS